MNGAERGFLLLTSRLGNPERKVLSMAQVRILANRVRMGEKGDPQRELEERDLVALGYGRQTAGEILGLLQEEQLLEHYCRRGEKIHCFPLTRAGKNYPSALREKLGEETPGCLWYKGDISLLEQPMVALVGSRDLLERNRRFAAEVGRQAARQGYVLVSGNARGADKTAQRACLQAGGKVISVVADDLSEKQEDQRILYLSEDEYDAPFSAQRAISRNRVIHALGERTFVAQCGYQEGGTWSGTVKNLRHGWSSVYGFRDGSPAMELLEQMGAELIEKASLSDMAALPVMDPGFLG